MKPHKQERANKTATSPPDELAVRRHDNQAQRLTPSQLRRIERLLVAAELRQKANRGG